MSSRSKIAKINSEFHLVSFFKDGDRTINVTGGGAYKFSDLISEKLGLKVIKVDEMSCLGHKKPSH